MVAWNEKRRNAKKQLKIPALKKVKEMYPNVIQGAQMCKWIKAAEKEKWSDLPEVMKSRCAATPNAWRKRIHGLRPKGKAHGGSVPLPLQVELDKLMADMSSGASSISERKELVTTEHVASCQHQHCNYLYNTHLSISWNMLKPT